MAPTTSASPGTKDFKIKVATQRSWLHRVAIGFRRCIVADNQKFTDTFTFIMMFALGLTAYITVLFGSFMAMLNIGTAISIAVFVLLVSPLIIWLLKSIVLGIRKNMPRE